eukprot:4303621-Lingulodinium_polyedra.AAC.1
MARAWRALVPQRSVWISALAAPQQFARCAPSASPTEQRPSSAQAAPISTRTVISIAVVCTKAYIQ